MRYLIYMVVLVLTASGCAGTTARQVGPNTWSITCKRHQDKCWQRAGRLCPHGYKHVSESSQVTGAQIISGDYLVSGHEGHLVVTCERASEERWE